MLGRIPPLKERLIARIPKGIIADDPVFSPTGRLVACVGSRRGRGDSPRLSPVRMYVNGRPGSEYGMVRAPQFSPCEEHVAYVGENRRREFVVVDQMKQKGFDQVTEYRFTPDGKHVVFVASKGGKWYLVDENGPGKPFEEISDIGFDSLGAPFYVGRRRGKAHLVTSGGIGEAFDSITVAELGDSGKITFIGERDGKYLLSTGDRLLGPYDRILGWAFSASGNRLAYTIGIGEKWRLIIDGEPGPVLDSLSEPVFSPDGHRVAYAARKGTRYRVTVGDETGEPFAYASKPVFTPDGRSVAYWANRGGRCQEDVWVKGGKWCLVMNGKPHTNFKQKQSDEAINEPPSFSPDERTVGGIVKDADDAFVVIGDKAYRKEGFIGKLVIGNNGFAYNSLDQRGGILVINGKRMRDYDYVGDPILHPKGDRIAFGARIGRELWWKVASLH